MAHLLKEKGDVGVAKVIADATSQKWNVCIPITEHASYDLIVEKEGTINRVQVRYTSQREGKLDVKLKSSWADKNGSHIRKRQIEDFDVLAVYCPENDKVYYIKSDLFSNGTGITLRLTPSKNGQRKGVRMAKHFQALK